MKRFGTAILIALPAFLGLAITILFNLFLPTNPVLFLRVDMGTLGLLIGIFMTLALGIGYVISCRKDQVHQYELDQFQSEAFADRRRFLQRLDHELKNPITAIHAGLANLNGVPAPNMDALESVKTQAVRLSRLVADLRKIAELETRPIERVPVDLGGILQELLEIAQDRPEWTQRRLTLILPQAPWPLPHVSGDHDLLFLAAHNLLDNALKFTEEGDTVEVRAFEDGWAVVVEVADTGPGIPADEIPYVWQELYRGKGARGVAGSGLGLSLVRAIVERHEGEVSIRSRVPQGTVVAIRLPISGGSNS